MKDIIRDLKGNLIDYLINIIYFVIYWIKTNTSQLYKPNPYDYLSIQNKK